MLLMMLFVFERDTRIGRVFHFDEKRAVLMTSGDFIKHVTRIDERDIIARV